MLSVVQGKDHVIKDIELANAIPDNNFVLHLSEGILGFFRNQYGSATS
jgi:hypothetical protein